MNSLLHLPPDKEKYNIVCIASSEVNPEEIASRYAESHSGTIKSYGALMGWNDNDWHIILIGKQHFIIVAMKSYLFPLGGEGACLPYMDIEFDREIKRVKIKR